MKIAMIGHKRIPGREGGIEVVVEELTTRMAKRNHMVTAYNRNKKNVKKLKEYNKVEIINVPTIEKKSTDAIVYSFIASILCLFKKYDIIHYHGIGPSLMLIIPKIFKKKVVVTVHGLNYKTPKWKGLGAKVMKLGEKVTAKFANTIIVLSKEQQKYFKEKYNRETIYIPNGVTINDINEPNIIKSKWNLEKDKYILFLSRVVPGKGLEYLIDAYKQINTNVQLIIAGGTEYVDDFYDMIVKKVADDKRIKMIGFVKGEEISELYSNARAFIFPSEAEGMPMCLLEALSFNTPCLVSDIPENLNVAFDYVTSFESKNTEDLKIKLEKILNNNKKSMNSREYIKNEYSWEKIVDDTLNVYKQLINNIDNI